VRLGWLALIGLALPGALPAAVPFVGCASDGQMGPLRAPRAGPAPHVAPALAGRLAFYRSSALGVLAPRGWHCIGLYGSNGAILIVTPAAYRAEDFFSNRAAPRGPAIQLTQSDGGTSGRFDVAALIARLFPAHIAFARRVAAEGIGDPLPTGPYPSDRLDRRSAREVRYLTPGGRRGLGTENRFARGTEPVRGLVLLLGDEADDEPSALKLDVRLPDALASAIIDDAGRRYAPRLQPRR
jgi:hypothetical protein